MQRVDWATGALHGPDVQISRKTIGDLKNLFLDSAAAENFPADTLLYTVQWWSPVSAGTGGATWSLAVDAWVTLGSTGWAVDRVRCVATFWGARAAVAFPCL